ncbi:MAG: zinc-dependent metalloprotease [Phycisphaerae bacterium]|nr:zinc-dependent metalloprotease [Phycisphaerae bacterium]
MTLRALIGVVAGSMAAADATANERVPHVRVASLWAIEPALSGEFGVRVALNPGRYDELKSAERITLADVPIAAETAVTLEVRRFDVFAPDSRIITMIDGIEQPLPRPDLVLLRGHVAGDPAARVYLALSPHGSNGWIELDGRLHVLSSGPANAGRATLLYDATRLPAGAIELVDWRCDAEAIGGPVAVPPQRPPVADAIRASAAARDAPPCRHAEIAVETDYEYTANVFGGDTSAATAYVGALIGAVSEIYERDINTTLSVTFLRLWTSADDPWTQSGTTNQLFEFQDYWNLNMTAVARSAAHFLSGRALGGGVAYVTGLCYPEYDYGLSANLNGFFPYPIENNSIQNWDLMVTAHELGHNFGAPHTHSMSPPVDNCAGGDCSVTPNGTIMSYCHLCPGGLANVRMELHARTISETILPFLDQLTFCNLVVPCPGNPGDCNNDGALDELDVPCFVDVLIGTNTDPGAMSRSDMTSDSANDALDLQPFVDALLAP